MSRLSKQILQYLGDRELHSGQDLANILGVTRAAIWKEIKQLQKRGLEIESTKSHGYCLMHPLEFLDENKMRLYFTPTASALWSNILIFDKLESTNKHLLEKTELPSGTICFAEEQTIGRGRRGRRWFAPYTHNLCFSVLWEFDAGNAFLDGFSLAVGVAVTKALQKLGIEDIGIKWPNDLMYKDHKLAGILLETYRVLEGACRVVIGIGINTRLPKQASNQIEQNFIDLESIVSKPVSRNLLAAEILNELSLLLPMFLQTGIASYLSDWNTLNVLQEKMVTVKTMQTTYEGVVKGVDHLGHIQVQCNDGQLRTFSSADVSVRKLTTETV